MIYLSLFFRLARQVPALSIKVNQRSRAGVGVVVTHALVTDNIRKRMDSLSMSGRATPAGWMSRTPTARSMPG